MNWINVEEIKRDLFSYLQCVAVGKTIIIIHAGKPIAELKHYKKGFLSLRPTGSTSSIMGDFEGR